MGDRPSGRKGRRAASLAAAAASVLLAIAGCTQPTGPRVEGALTIDVPELCTRCVEVLRCEGAGRRVAYVMAEKSAWAQVATIWDYFAAFFRPKTEDFRDLGTYELGAQRDEVIAYRGAQRARLDVWRRRIELPDAVVEQRSGAWLSADGRTVGACTHLPRGEDRRYAAQLEASRPR